MNKAAFVGDSVTNEALRKPLEVTLIHGRPSVTVVFRFLPLIII